MKQKRLAALLTAVLLLAAAPAQALAAGGKATVTLPSFKVTINGMTIDNNVRKYPLIVYKNITYFPMTYYDCRFLGVETKFKKESGLEVTKAGVPQSYRGETGARNAGKYTASIAPFPVKVNGKAIDNSKEEYPLLLFRNVTYFPLTYRFAAAEFGWDYSFDAKNGLVISEKSAAASGGVAVTEVTLPIVQRDEYSRPAFTLAGDYFYYEGKGGKIYQAPVSAPSKAKAVYQLPLWSYGESYVYPQLRTIDDKAILTYHQGGAVMGTDYVFQLNADGTSKEIDSGYSYLRDFGDYAYRVNQGVPPFPNNLTVRDNSKPVAEDDYAGGFVPLGETGYIYGWATTGGGDYGSSDNMERIGVNLYLLAAVWTDGSGAGKSHVYAVNVETGKVQQITRQSAQNFVIQDGTLYFLTSDHGLYKKSMAFSEGGLLSNEEVRLADSVARFVVTGGNVFYEKAVNLVLAGQYDERAGVVSANSHAEAGELFRDGAAASVNPGGIVESLTVQEGYVIATFTEDSESPYKLMVLNKDGKVIYKSSEEAAQVIINKGKLIFVKS